jgi:hypothetical protein
MQLEIESPNASRSRRDEIMERLFGDFQVAYFNQLYYQSRAKSVKRMIRWANVIAAVSASVAVTTLLKDAGAVGFLVVLTVLSAVSAAVAPVLGLEDKYSQLQQAGLGYTIVKDRLCGLLRDLKMSELDDSHEAREREIAAFRDALGPLDLNEEPHASLMQSCWEKVERELPAEKAWSII